MTWIILELHLPKVLKLILLTKEPAQMKINTVNLRGAAGSGYNLTVASVKTVQRSEE